MTIESIKRAAKLFVQGNLGGEEFGAIYNEFNRMYFDYEKVKLENAALANLLEEINEDVSRFEPSDKLRNEHPEYYIDEEGLRKSVRRLIT